MSTPRLAWLVAFVMVDLACPKSTMLYLSKNVCKTKKTLMEKFKVIKESTA